MKWVSSDARGVRHRVRRHPERGHYDVDSIDAILDEALVCHLGVVIRGEPWVLPTIHARVGDQVYVHGAVAAASLKAMASPAVCCLTVTLVDGLVLARSAFNHSLNYRSVVVRGFGTLVSDPVEKLMALKALVEHVAPGRWEDARPPSPLELRATQMVRLPLAGATAKIRTGPVKDDVEDLGWPHWAGVLPLQVTAGAVEPDSQMANPTAPTPEYLANYVRARR